MRLEPAMARVLGRVAVAVVTNDADAVHVAAAGAQAVGHAQRRVADARRYAWVGNVVSRVHALTVGSSCNRNEETGSEIKTIKL